MVTKSGRHMNFFSISVPQKFAIFEVNGVSFVIAA